MSDTSDYPYWSDEDWSKAKTGAPWDWDRELTKQKLLAIVEAAARRDVDSVQVLAKEALRELH